MQLKEMEQTAAHVSGLLKLLSHRDRLMALCHLTQGELAAGALAEAVGMKPPAMSQQLAILRRDDAVASMGFLYDRFCGDEVSGDVGSKTFAQASAQ